MENVNHLETGDCLDIYLSKIHSLLPVSCKHSELFENLKSFCYEMMFVTYSNFQAKYNMLSFLETKVKTFDNNIYIDIFPIYFLPIYHVVRVQNMCALCKYSLSKVCCDKRRWECDKASKEKIILLYLVK